MVEPKREFGKEMPAYSGLLSVREAVWADSEAQLCWKRQVQGGGSCRGEAGSKGDPERRRRSPEEKEFPREGGARRLTECVWRARARVGMRGSVRGYACVAVYGRACVRAHAEGESRLQS